MKTRNGFVSNSSSASFVLGKAYMSHEQVDAFRKWLDERQDTWYEGYIEDTNLYFHGEIGVYRISETLDFLNSIGISSDFVGILEKE